MLSMTTLNGLPLTWDCMVCGQERADRFISVHHRTLLGMESAFPDTRVNVRFCNDTVSCQDGAWTADRWHAGPFVA